MRKWLSVQAVRQLVGRALVRLGCRCIGWKPDQCVTVVLVDQTPSEVGMWAARFLAYVPLPRDTGLLMPPNALGVFTEEFAAIQKGASCN